MATITLDVTLHEHRMILRALTDPDTRALVVTIGILLGLPTDSARRHVLMCIEDALGEAIARTKMDA